VREEEERRRRRRRRRRRSLEDSLRDFAVSKWHTLFNRQVRESKMLSHQYSA
jgi:hypothetical protein